MSFIKIWIHAVWGTKSREQILTQPARTSLFQHIKENGKEKGIYIDFVNGYYDHVHCLFTMNTDLSIGKTMQLIKGESSFWVNSNKLFKQKLEWADEYFAVSVSESMIDKVRDYIKNQEAHHQKITFAQEYDEFISKYGFPSLK
jgi:putative transposase